MKLTAVIINYNYSRFLRQRIESVLGQTYTDIEVIMIDDHSTDDSVEIMRQYPQARLQVNAENSGRAFEQWKNAISLATGDYIWIAEADDYADPNFVSALLTQIERNDLVACMSASVMVDEQGTPTGQDHDHWHRRKIEEGSVDIFDGVQFARNQMYWHNRFYNASGVIFRREAVTPEALAALQMRYSGDWLFWVNLMRQGRIGIVNRRLNYFRQHPTSVTHSGAYPAFFEDVDAVRTIDRLFRIPLHLRLARRWKLLRRLGRMGFTHEQVKQLRRYILS